MKRSAISIGIVCCSTVLSCAPRGAGNVTRLIPAEEFSRKARTGEIVDFSIYKKVAEQREGTVLPSDTLTKNAQVRGALVPVAAPLRNEEGKGKSSGVPFPHGDRRYLDQGLELRRSIAPALPVYERDWERAGAIPSSAVPLHGPPAELPVGSSAPYLNGQMTANPSLWPDEGQGAALFRDFRAFQPMDVVTILINERTEGRKKAKTDAKSEFSITAGIAQLLGIETKSWESNNEALDAEKLVNAQTNLDFKGEGETKREGRMQGRLSAIILEVLPNGLLRIEGTKIVSVDNEEEIMVVSGLVRQRDIDAANQVDSSRIANMRIDFYGKGVVGDQMEYGWGTKLFKWLWPF